LKLFYFEIKFTSKKSILQALKFNTKGSDKEIISLNPDSHKIIQMKEKVKEKMSTEKEAKLKALQLTLDN
jgi:hypothetical protein